jgi:hypothetical protein
MEKYIFFAENDNTATASGYSIDTVTNTLKNIGFSAEGQPIPRTVRKEILIKKPSLFIIMTREEFKTINNNTNTNEKIMYDKNGSIIPVENVKGQLQTGRVETPFGGGGEIMTVRVTYNYTTVTVPGALPVMSTLIGDAFGMMRAVNTGLDTLAAAKANGLVETGTFGGSTTSVLRAMSTKGVRFHIFQAEAAAASYWTNKVPARLLTANVQGSAQAIDMNFQLFQDGSQFNANIRQIPNFRFTISERTAIQILVNEGESAAFTFQARATGLSNIMELEA